MLPIFKTHCSFGKSLLTEEHPKKYKKGGKKSIFSIAEENNLKSLVVIEDSMVGFYDMHKTAKELGIKLIFGLYFKVGHPDHKSFSKIAILAKSDKGLKYMMNLYTKCNTENKGFLNVQDLKSKDVEVVVPFFDSFIYYNIIHEDPIMVDLKGLNPTFLIEDKGIHFEGILRSKVEKYCKSNGFKMMPAHSVYYEKNEDAMALQVYKMSCFRRGGGGKASIGNPNLTFFASDKFSMENYLKITS